METKTNYILIGIFVLVLGAVFVGGILWLGVRPTKKYDKYWVYMTESVSGLNRDAPVKYRGVEVGRVDEIKIDEENPEQVRILLAIEPGTPIREDTTAVLETQGLTGIAFVNLKGKNRDSPLLKPTPAPPYPVIPSSPSLLMRLDVGVSDLLASITRTSDSLHAFLEGPSRQDLTESLAHLKQVLALLAVRADSLDQVIQSATHTLEKSAKASDHLPELLSQLKETGAGLHKMAAEISQQSNEVGKAAVAGAAGMNRFMEDARVELYLLTEELQRLLRRLEGLAVKLEEEPQSLLFGGPKPRPGPGE